MSVNGHKPLPAWTIQQALQEAGVDSKRVQVDPAGQVTVDQKPIGQLVESKDVEAFAELVRGPETETEAPKQKPFSMLETRLRQLEMIRITQRANDRWCGTKLQSGIDDKYTGGKAFTVPIVELPAGRGRILKMDRPNAEVDGIEKFFSRPGGAVAMPVHPQEMSFRGFSSQDDGLEGARCASSERTVHTNVVELRNAFLKLDLAHITHSGVKRPIEAQNAKEVVAKTAYIMNWIDKYSAQDTAGRPIDSFAFLPEPMAVIDDAADAAVIVRLGTPYPPLPNGQQSWALPLFSATAVDQDFPNDPPMMIRLVQNRPDKSISPEAYFEEKMMRPLIASALRVYVDLGATAQCHPQNMLLELDENGELTGRVIHQDLEDLWQDPTIAKAQGREDMYQNTGLNVTDAGMSVLPNPTFWNYFFKHNFALFVACFERSFPDTNIRVQARRAFEEELTCRPNIDTTFARLVRSSCAQFVRGVRL